MIKSALYCTQYWMMFTRILLKRSHFISSWFDHSALSSSNSLHTLTMQRLNGTTVFLCVSTPGIFQLLRGLKYVSKLSKRCPDCYYIREEDPRLPWPFRLILTFYLIVCTFLLPFYYAVSFFVNV